METIKQQKEEDIKDLKKRHEALEYQKDKQARQNKNATKKLERYHYEEVQELEDLYKKKLALEGDAYLKLEQQGLENR